MAPTTTRRTLLAGGTMLLADPAAAQQVTTLKLYSPNFEADVAMLAFEVPSRTGGRYQIEPIIGFDRLEAALGKERAVGGERTLLEGARSGELDLVVCGALPVGDYVPEAHVFLLPFLFDDYVHARAALDGAVGQDMLGKLPAYGLVGLAWTEAGFRHVANGMRPIRSPEDLRGLRLRTAQNPVVIEAFRTLGVEVVPMPWTRPVLDALAQGALDGVETDVDAIINWEVFQWAQYLSLTRHVYTPAVTIMSKAAYDKLSDTDKQAFAEAAQLASQAERKFNDDADAAGLAQLLSAGMKINADVDKAAFRAALAPAYTKWRQQFGGLIDRIQAYR
jgi:TRAP-type C4-dicarboxylate transport system substrate-binding protein